MPDLDAIAGKEQLILNDLLTKVLPRAREGDDGAIDRVLKILDLKRKYRLDAQLAEEEWKGS